MYQRALAYRAEHITNVDTWDEFEKVLKKKVDLLQRIGTELQLQKIRSKRKQKLLYVVFLWIIKKKQANVFSPVIQANREYYLL